LTPISGILPASSISPGRGFWFPSGNKSMKEKIKTQKGFIQIPLLVMVIVFIVIVGGIGYGVIKHNKTSKIIREVEQPKNLGIKKQEITDGLDRNKKLLEDKSEYIQGIEEEKARRIAIEAQLELERQLTREQILKLQRERQEAEERWVEAETKRAIEELLRIGPLLQDYYNEIRNARGLGKNWWLYGYQEEVNFASYLAKHSLAKIYWPEYEAVYHTLTGSYSYLDAKEILDAVFVEYAIGITPFYPYYENYSDTEKIERILDFINFHISYEPDFNQILRAPPETLGFKSGDCDDYSILISALFANVGINSAIMFVESTDRTEAHAMVLFQSKETLPLWSYSDLTWFGLPSGEWYILEPQFTLEEHQQNPDWFKKWDIVAAALVGKLEPSTYPIQ